MKPLEIKGARTRLGYTQRYMAEKLGISVPSYQKKESGQVKFAEEEKIQVGEILQLTPIQFNEYLYDGKLPIFKEAIS